MSIKSKVELSLKLRRVFKNAKKTLVTRNGFIGYGKRASLYEWGSVKTERR